MKIANRLKQATRKNLSIINPGGFTIIEVMIVLAIAGLILTIVFIAVPQLQRNARDNSRQNIVARIKSEMETYASNNQGLYAFQTGCSKGTPGCWTDFHDRYLGGNKVNIKDPSTGAEVISASPSGSASQTASSVTAFTSSSMDLPDKAGVLSVIYGARCSGENVAASGLTSPNSRNYAILIGLDRDGTRFCLDNG